MTDGHVYAVASGKGGVGKTTTAVNLGAGFAEAGRSVVVVDVDLGMANLDDFLDVDPAPATLHDVLAGDEPLDDAIMEAPGDFDVVLGSPDIEAFGRADPAELRSVLPDLREAYDIVVLDGGGGLSHDMTVPLGLADEIILVTTPADAAVTNASKTMDLVAHLDTAVTGVIVTRLGGAGGTTPERVGDRLDLSVLGSVPEDGAIQMSATKGTPLVIIDRESPAAQSYREIAYALVDEPLPRDWAEDSADPMSQAMAPGSESAEGESPAENEAAAEDSAAEPADETEDGIADRLERMERAPDADAEGAEAENVAKEAESDTAETEPTNAGPIMEAEPDKADDRDGREAESEGDESFFSRLFGGMFG